MAPIAHPGKDNRKRRAPGQLKNRNAKGVTIGGKKVKLELKAEDDAADPKQGTAAAQKLADRQVAGVVGHLNSGYLDPCFQNLQRRRHPADLPVGHEPKFTLPGSSRRRSASWRMT
ncbi:hypothetical protein [Candidatus Skiveiella danica]|uniref:hypothetical protein n=1 Tax=Candidatus Skiveiella danica TaxID=3386177 RepID=UPI0039B8DE3D